MPATDTIKHHHHQLFLQIGKAGLHIYARGCELLAENDTIVAYPIRHFAYVDISILEIGVYRLAFQIYISARLDMSVQTEFPK